MNSAPISIEPELVNLIAFDWSPKSTYLSLSSSVVINGLNSLDTKGLDFIVDKIKIKKQDVSKLKFQNLSDNLIKI